jgi:hypothetical protein
MVHAAKSTLGEELKLKSEEDGRRNETRNWKAERIIWKIRQFSNSVLF